MIAYASRTGTRRNLARLRAAGWRLMVCAAGSHRHEGFAYALDNGAFSLWQREKQGTPVDWSADDTWSRYVRLLDRLGACADWAVAPDIPTQGAASLALSLRWLPIVLRRTPRALIAVQNGMTIDDLAPHLSRYVGVFIGGDDAWKERATGEWGPWCAARGIHCHVGRVNTARRVRLCAMGRVSSFDGSSATRYAVTVPLIDGARRQPALPMDFGPVCGTRRPAAPSVCDLTGSAGTPPAQQVLPTAGGAPVQPRCTAQAERPRRKSPAGPSMQERSAELVAGWLRDARSSGWTP